MVLAARYRQRRIQEERQKGRQEGLQEGREEAQEEWEAWNERRLQAEASGEPFHEAPPSQRQATSDSNRKNP